MLTSNTFAGAPEKNVYTRVLAIQVGKVIGTAFTLDKDGRQYMVTAKHLVASISDTATIHVLDNYGKVSSVSVKVLRPNNDSIDIAVAIPDRLITPSLELVPSIDSIPLATDMYFLGYPNMLFSQNNLHSESLQPPFVKKGILSALQVRRDRSNLLFVDAMNNPGFSGGPIVWYHEFSKRWKVAGVVSGYLETRDTVLKDTTDTGLRAVGNSGILVGWGINAALEIIDDHPVGPPISTKVPGVNR